jgi:protein SCO1/2
LDTITEGTFKRRDTVYHEIPDFSFTNQYGQTVTKEQFPDKILIVDFFFTSCPTICPTMSEQLARVQSQLIRDDRVVLVSYTIDPTRDTPEKLKAYGEEYGAVPGKWQFLTGDKEEIYQLARKGYKMSALDEGGDDEHDGFVHTDRFVVVDPNWNIRGYYSGTSERDVNIMLGDMLLLLEEFKR